MANGFIKKKQKKKKNSPNNQENAIKERQYFDLSDWYY